MKLVLSLLVVLAVLTGCPTANPIKEAQTTEQKAYATYGTFVIFEELAAKIVTSPGTSASVKASLATADAKAKPIMDKLLVAVQEVEVAQGQLRAGKTTQDKVNIASANLSTWLTQAIPLVDDLVSAVKGGTQTAQLHPREWENALADARSTR